MSISEQRISTSLTLSHPGPPSSGRIATIESLREHLQWAIELEHFTLPPYLCALYSLDADRNLVATQLLTRQILRSAIGAMFTLKAQAQVLMQTPTEDGLATAGPTFEYVASDRRVVRPQSAGERIH